MNVVTTIDELRTLIKPYRNHGKSIGLVPTMGFLHEGHMSLVDQAKKYSDLIVMSIFVNPMQFGPGEDFERYPRNIEQDQEMAKARGVDILFVPEVKEIYPQKSKTVVSVSGVTERLCGASRPGHFDGVATVVSKLFNIVQPDYAFFGQKDAQQVAVIEQMVDDLNIPIQVIACPIVREKDGLAMSSRNVYLNEEERKQAIVLQQSLQLAEEGYKQGKTPAEICKQMHALIHSKPLAQIDYIQILSYPALEPMDAFEGSSFIMALAVKFGNTRLIDNKLIVNKRRDQHDPDHDERKNSPCYSY